MRKMKIPQYLHDWVIVIAEDDPDSLRIITLLLEKAGATVIATPDGQMGLEAIQKEKPRLVVSDLSMPHVDGYTLLKKIADHPDLTTIPVIALTAHAMEGDRERTLEVGFKGYISKPVNPATFYSELYTILENIPSLSEALKASQPNAD
jgi:CheY-like chemotaxis protein